MIEEGLPKMSLLIWRKLVCGLQSLATLMNIARVLVHLNGLLEI
jgi:hypothetical protein